MTQTSVGGLSGNVAENPLAKLNVGLGMGVKRAVTERATLPTSGSLTLATLTGSGTIRSIWSVVGPGIHTRDIRLQVFVDGETSPGVDVDYGSLFLSGGGAPVAGFHWSTNHMHGEGLVPTGANIGSGGGGGWMRFPIPYSNGCVVKIINHTGTTANFYALVDYQPGPSSEQRLRSICLPAISEQRVAFGADLPLFQTPVDSPGTFVALSYSARGEVTGSGYLERDVQVYIDNEITPSYGCSGTEDFFFSSYYFQNRSSITSPVTGMSYHDAFETEVVVDLLEHNGGIPFSSNLKCTLPADTDVAVSHSYSFMALFYTPASSTWGQPNGNGLVTSEPLNARASTGGSGKAVVTWNKPISVAGSLTGYVVTASPGGATAVVGATPGLTGRAATSTVVSGLTNNTAYTFTVAATTTAGTGPSGSASNSVTPQSSDFIPSSPAIPLRGWFKADHLPVNAGVSVAVWPDLSGEDRPFIQPKATLQPIRQSAIINGLQVLRSQGTWMKRSPDNRAPGAVSFGLIIRIPGGTTLTSKKLLGGSVGSWIVGTDGTGKLVVNSGGSDVGVVTIAASGLYVITGQTGASANLWLNGVAGTSGNSGTSAIGSELMDTNYVNSSGLDTDWLEYVVYEGTWSSSDRHAVEAYLGTRAGVSMTVA